MVIVDFKIVLHQNKSGTIVGIYFGFFHPHAEIYVVNHRECHHNFSPTPFLEGNFRTSIRIFPWWLGAGTYTFVLVGLILIIVLGLCCFCCFNCFGLFLKVSVMIAMYVTKYLSFQLVDS